MRRTPAQPHYKGQLYDERSTNVRPKSHTASAAECGMLILDSDLAKRGRGHYMSRKIFVRLAVSASALLAAVSCTGAAASGSNADADSTKTISLHGDLSVDGVTYYSTPHVKGGNHTITFSLKSLSGPNTNGGDVDFNIGIRNQSAPGDEDSNFPEVRVGHTVTLKNIRNNSDNWGATTYYFNAKWPGSKSSSPGNSWTGSSISNWQ